MWSDLKKKLQKRFLVPRFLGITYIAISIILSNAVAICPQNCPKHLTQVVSILVERIKNQNIEVLLFW